MLIAALAVAGVAASAVTANAMFFTPPKNPPAATSSTTPPASTPEQQHQQQAAPPATAPAEGTSGATTAQDAPKAALNLPAQEPIPANAVRVAEFVAECPFTHRLPDDPIVLPNLPGASHMHSFFGNVSTNAHTTVEDLDKAETSCNPKKDLSSYWVPTLLVDGQPVEPTGTTFYYLGEGVRDDVTARIQPLPHGLRIVAGNAKATAPDGSTQSRWSCLHAGHVEPSKDFVNCPEGSMLESYLDFPQCWNGKDLDSADHKSHMAYPVANECPSTHPVPVPKLRQVLRYPVTGDPARIKLASGPGFTMHGDFFNAWPEEDMALRVRDCINRIVKCGPDGRP
ncbi:DUF1996 domain-containing protein [Lentzea fradiae]|uniref:DUF1996 domain-containing protein n=1 Tax=Lentzea fradiae TaxID=200378 RepID=UPI001C409598|nr:DUF1996 domain-containing protein [Lentzea fradiae]